MDLNELNAISPIDGRYRKQVEELAKYFSEGALIKYRVKVEVEYFIALCEIPLPELNTFDQKHFPSLRKIYEEFKEEDALRIKTLEKTTNHDVKAVEYFLKEEFKKLGLQEFKEFIHFGLTSQDINNTATPLLLMEAMLNVYDDKIDELLILISELIKKWYEIPMLARTHGQPASPTRLGKELEVFEERIIGQLDLLESVPFAAKFGGATGNFNAHKVAYPNIDWVEFGNNFVEETLGLSRTQVTTQIEPYDNLAALFDNMKRINTILIDLNRDMWTYISMDYFKQTIKKDEVGSSAMPHKVNPIDFENSEGNLGIANALFEHFAAKLPISRLQRDLTDSTVLRNIGVPIAHTLLAIKSLIKGLNKLQLNQDAINVDLENNWAVVTEGIQTILRKHGYPAPYEELKNLSRTNGKIGKAEIHQFIDKLNIDEKIKDLLKTITPFNYTGI
jgi:adenylosuccinate lyase